MTNFERGLFYLWQRYRRYVVSGEINSMRHINWIVKKPDLVKVSDIFDNDWKEQDSYLSICKRIWKHKINSI